MDILKNKFLWIILAMIPLFYMASRTDEQDIYQKLNQSDWIVVCHDGPHYDMKIIMDMRFMREGYFITGIADLEQSPGEVYNRYHLEINSDSVFIDFGTDKRFLGKYYIQQSECLLGYHNLPNYLYLIGENESYVIHRIQPEKEMVKDDCSQTPEMLTFINKCTEHPYGRFDLSKGNRIFD